MRAARLCQADPSSQLGNHDEAVADCNAALQLNSGYVKAIRTRARANLAREAYEDAVNDFKKALEESETSGTPADVASLKKELRGAEIDLKRSKKKECVCACMRPAMPADALSPATTRSWACPRTPTRRRSRRPTGKVSWR